ncbi:uncharacterized protein LOC105422692 [Pogonomyrmex barbatus]|uniref:Uncharacterized protein LOC105422692 n=1 Tax=Pogonomyrmex barbatus TaxID=144034 RepID=A0A6I9VX62_9HYME|nr:uncharacterized protein LOC105422692 [Pogonomyrmex barbatus]
MKKHANLLYVQNPRDDNSGHFTCIKNLSRFVSLQLNKKEHKKYFCDRCLHYFSSSEKWQSHIMDYERMNDCAIRLPSENDKWLEKQDTSYTYQQHEVFSSDATCDVHTTMRYRRIGFVARGLRWFV